MKTADFVCDGCKHPQVPIAILISKLGLANKTGDFSERTWRRYVNAKQPMPLDQFRWVVVHALMKGWLDVLSALAVSGSINDLLVSQQSLLALLRRARERKAFIERGEFDLSEEEFEREQEKQRRLLDHETTAEFNELIVASDTPPEARETLEQMRLARMSKPQPD